MFSKMIGVCVCEREREREGEREQHWKLTAEEKGRTRGK